MNVNSIEKQV